MREQPIMSAKFHKWLVWSFICVEPSLLERLGTGSLLHLKWYNGSKLIFFSVWLRLQYITTAEDMVPSPTGITTNLEVVIIGVACHNTRMLNLVLIATWCINWDQFRHQNPLTRGRLQNWFTDWPIRNGNFMYSITHWLWASSWKPFPVDPHARRYPSAISIFTF